MATPTNLNQYYTGLGQALPSVSDRATTYSAAGLGSGYTGTAAQNQALLNHLTSSGGSSGSSAGGYSSPSNSTPTPTSGGYSSDTPSGDPVLSQDIASLNSNQNQLQGLTAQQASDLNAFTAQQQGTISNAYTTAMGQTGLQDKQNTYNSLDNAYIQQQALANAAPLTALQSAGGHDVMTSTADAAGSTNTLAPSLAASNYALALAPAENALSTAMQNTQNIAGNIVSGAQLAEQGFTAGQQEQLAALESKISQGQQLTNDEYQSYSTLKSAQVGAAAQIQSANISAGATLGAANIGAQAGLKEAALQYPGVIVNPSGNGTYTGSTFLNTTTPTPNPVAGPPAPANVTAANNALKAYGF